MKTPNGSNYFNGKQTLKAGGKPFIHIVEYGGHAKVKVNVGENGFAEVARISLVMSGQIAGHSTAKLVFSVKDIKMDK